MAAPVSRCASEWRCAFLSRAKQASLEEARQLWSRTNYDALEARVRCPDDRPPPCEEYLPPGREAIAKRFAEIRRQQKQQQQQQQEQQLLLDAQQQQQQQQPQEPLPAAAAAQHLHPNGIGGSGVAQMALPMGAALWAQPQPPPHHQRQLAMPPACGGAACVPSFQSDGLSIQQGILPPTYCA